MNTRTLPTRALWIVAAALAAWAGRAGPARAQSTDRCLRAQRFLEGTMRMAVVTEADRVEDWRSGRRLPGCRVTAAGTTRADPGEAASRLFQGLREAGWERTPDPRDAPGESSLRFRLEGTDCLFTVYRGVRLGTEAELEVSASRVPEPGASRVHVLVLCVPALDAAPRDAFSLLAPGDDRTLLFTVTRLRPAAAS